MVTSYINCARSSGDRALASEAMCVGSIPAGRTIRNISLPAVLLEGFFALDRGHFREEGFGYIIKNWIH